MERLQSIEAFKSLQARLTADRDPNTPTIVIPAGTCGQASGANDLIRVTKRELLERGLTDKIRLRVTGCHGYCEAEPSVLVEPRGTFYPKVDVKRMVRIVEAVAGNKAAGVRARKQLREIRQTARQIRQELLTLGSGPP